MNALPPIRIETRGLTRLFGTFVANDDISIQIHRGSIHAFLGGNGAGKTTLMRMLQGLCQPTGGDILIDGQRVVLSSPQVAFRHGIGMVHQEFNLVSGLTLLENLVLGAEPVGRSGVVDWKAARCAAEELARTIGVAVDWDATVSATPLHVLQVIEILRILYRGADILILDEPSAVLAHEQVASLLGILRRLRDNGRTILFISHRLNEVLDIADRITVLREGRHQSTIERISADRNLLMREVTGEDIVFTAPAEQVAGEVCLTARGVCVTDDSGVVRTRDISLDIRAGEILAITGAPGRGQIELLEVLAGLRRAAAGTISIDGRNITACSVTARRRAGIRYLSADRATESLCRDMSIRDNAIAGRHRVRPFSRLRILDHAAIRAHTAALLDRFSVRRPADDLPVGVLSGGNQQRVALARELDGASRILLVAQPTRGVDLAGIAFIHGVLRDFVESGGAVVMVSEDRDEVEALASRVLQLREDGRLLPVHAA